MRPLGSLSSSLPKEQTLKDDLREVKRESLLRIGLTSEYISDAIERRSLASPFREIDSLSALHKALLVNLI